MRLTKREIREIVRCGPRVLVERLRKGCYMELEKESEALMKKYAPEDTDE